MFSKIKKSKSEKTEQKIGIRKSLTQYRPTQSFTLILNYFGKLVTIPTHATNQDTTLMINNNQK